MDDWRNIKCGLFCSESIKIWICHDATNVERFQQSWKHKKTFSVVLFVENLRISCDICGKIKVNWRNMQKLDHKNNPELMYKEYPNSSYTLGRYRSFLSHNRYTKKCKSQPTQIGKRIRRPMGNHFHCELIATLFFLFYFNFF